jgi:branched-chain amino acid transport system ATP-binding protein
MTDTLAPDTPSGEEPAAKTGWLHSITGDGPLYALLILFGLNAVDELDRTAFAVLAPDIRDEFGLGFAGLLTLVAVVLAFALALQVPIAGMADRYPRVRIALIGAAMWAGFSFMTGLATGIVMLGFARSGSAIGKAVNDPTHNSLLADWFDPDHRPKVYSFHRAANAVGAIIGPIMAGVLAYQFGWRTPFLVFAIPTIILVVLGLRLREPVRGAHERRLAGGDEEAAATEEAPPSYAEAWRMCWKIETLRRIFVAMPFLAVSLIGFATLASLLYEQAYGLDERARGVVAATSEPGQLIGLVIGARIATKLVMRDPALILKFLAIVSAVSSALSLVFAVVPNLGFAIAANFLIALCLAIVGPGILASLSLAIPPRARSMGFSMASLWILPGLLMLPFIGWIADNWGIRTGMAMMVPVFLIGGLVIASGGNVIDNDIVQVRQTALARAEVMNQRRRGEVKLLLCRGVNVGYSGVRVLHDVDLEIDEGSVVALLGTNGAGKSTLLKAISGVVQADQGAIIFDGRDVTHAPPNEIAGHGIVQIPGGHGVFPGLTVQENLDAAGWLHRSDEAALETGMATVLETFPALASRLDEPAANLSGGQQQMLALGMSFLVTPRLLMIDELSLGLAPVIVERLLEMVRRIAASGVTVILVEQSVNVALELADTAYFMERGRIRFHGPTTELVERDDLLRSVFLGDAVAASEESSTASSNGAAPAPSQDPPLHDAPPDPSMALSVRGLSRRFGGLVAVNQVDVDVAEREIVGFIGPNGAGKTTAIRILAGLIRPTAGTVHLGGLDLSKERTRAALGLRTLVEVPSFYDGLSGEENLAVFARLARAPRSDVPRLLGALGLDHAARREVGGYSLGMRQRLGIAQALIGEPRLVVLDEPMNGLDPAAIHLVRELILEERRARGVTFFISSHLLHDVETLCDEVGIIHQGRMLAEGGITELLSNSVRGFRLDTADNEAARAALSTALPDAQVRLVPPGVVAIDGDESLLPALHRALLDAGLTPRAVAPIRDTLEGYFIEKTEGAMG